MAGSTIWKGYIHFGDTDVPVKLHASISEDRVRFHLLHRHDQVRLRQQMVCAYEKQPVSAEQQSKGFEVEEGRYVIVDSADLEQVNPEGSRMIEVHEFVKTGQIDPFSLDRLYYLEPDGSDIQGRGYHTLVKALKDLDVAGICTWVMRRRSYFGALQARGLHVPLARIDSPERPDSMVFDLDPGDQAGIPECARVALILRDLLSRIGLASYVKTSVKKGLHVYVPLNRKDTTFSVFFFTTRDVYDQQGTEGIRIEA